MPAPPLLITIDGPAGAGKTTVSKMLARRLGYTYVDTGALYRGVALAAFDSGTPADDEDALRSLCRGLTIGFTRGPDGDSRLLLDGKDVTDSIRAHKISMLASAISARAVVRRFLLDLQRDMGKRRAAVFEGRDMGTVVFPDADVKFFLVADLKTRALRRYRELGPGAGSMERVQADMARRDANDSSRPLAPLKPAPDAVRIDSTRLSAKQVVEEMIDAVRVVEERRRSERRRSAARRCAE
jgi:cytidylate kinase